MTMKNKSIKQLKCQQLQQKISRVVKLEALPVDNGWAALIVFLLGDPHLLEGGKGRQDGSSDPDGVFPLRGSNNLDLNGGWSQGSDFLLHSVGNTWVHSGTSRHDGVGVQVLTDVNIALHDGVVGGLVDTAGFHSQEGWLEEGLWGTETFVTNGDNLSIGQFIGFFQGGGSSSSCHFLFEVKSNVAELFLDVTDDFTFSGGGERVTSLGEDLHEVVGKLTSSQVQTEDGVWESITFIDGDGVGYTITRVHDNTSGTSRSIEGKDSLDGNIHSWHVEGLEHDLGHLFAVSFWVEWSFSQKYGLLFWCNTEFVVEGGMPDFLHVVPVGDDTVLNWVFQGKDTSLGLSFISNIGILLSHTYHDTLVTWASNNGWEDSSWGVITSKSSFAHAGAIVNDKSGYVFVTHLALL